MTGYPKWFMYSLIAALIGLLATGVLLTPTSLDLRLEWDVPWRLAADSRQFTVAAHSVTAFAVIFAIGALWPVHMRAGWRTKRNHITGVGLGVLMGGLFISSIGVLYAGSEIGSLLSVAGHLVLGYLLLPFALKHMLKGIRLRKSKRSRVVPPKRVSTSRPEYQLQKSPSVAS